MVVESGSMVRKISLKFEVYFRSGFLRMTLFKESSNDRDPFLIDGGLFLIVLQALVGKTQRLTKCDPVTWSGLCICRLATDASSLHIECERANIAFWRWGEILSFIYY